MEDHHPNPQEETEQQRQTCQPPDGGVPQFVADRGQSGLPADLLPSGAGDPHSFVESNRLDAGPARGQ